jgi:hypothetical protein
MPQIVKMQAGQASLIKAPPLRGAGGRHLRRPPALGRPGRRAQALMPLSPVLKLAHLARDRCCTVPSSSAI